MLEVERDRALAFRLAGQHLHERTDDPLAAIGACGVQDSPPGWAAVAVHARCTAPLPDDPRVVQVNAMRQAPFVVPRGDLPVFTTALVPEDPAGLRTWVGSRPAREVAEHGLTPREALDLVADAAREALGDGPLELAAFHQALRERLPDAVLPYCRGCGSHHVRSGFWRGLGPLGVTEMPARSTWQRAEHPPMDPVEARREAARRFLRTHGPASHTHLAAWAGCGPRHAKELLGLIGDELEAVRYARRPAHVLAEDLARLEDPPRAHGVRLLGGFDPYVAQPDRDAIAPDPRLRTRMFPVLGRPGAVLVDGVLRGLWTARKKGGTLHVHVDWLGDEADLAGELDAVARLRGAERAALS